MTGVAAPEVAVCSVCGAACEPAWMAVVAPPGRACLESGEAPRSGLNVIHTIEKRTSSGPRFTLLDELLEIWLSGNAAS